jgi:hypothetical protein
MPKNKPLKIQASSISRIMKCPGSCTLESKLPDRLRYFAYKDAAEYGTLCHAWGENRLLKAERIDLRLHSKIREHPRADEIYFIGKYYAERVNVLKLPVSKAFTEIKFRATVSGIDCVAKADAFFVSKTRFRGFDLKSGNFDYADSATAQIIFGARLWCYINDKKDGRILEAFTIQPAYYNEARRVVAAEPVEYDRSSFVAFIKNIKARQKEFNPGSHCKMCAAILTCKAVKNLTEEFFEMAKKANKDDLNFKDIYLKKDAVLAFLSALDDYLKNELESGKAIPGLTLELYSGHRRWLDCDMVIDKLAYLKDKIFKPRELKTPAQLEKIAGKENIAGLYESPKLKRVAIRENSFESFAE